MAKMERTLTFLDMHIARVWGQVRQAREEGKPFTEYEHILDNLLDQRIAVDDFEQKQSNNEAAPNSSRGQKHADSPSGTPTPTQTAPQTGDPEGVR